MQSEHLKDVKELGHSHIERALHQVWRISFLFFSQVELWQAEDLDLVEEGETLGRSSQETTHFWQCLATAWVKRTPSPTHSQFNSTSIFWVPPMCHELYRVIQTWARPTPGSPALCPLLWNYSQSNLGTCLWSLFPGLWNHPGIASSNEVGRRDIGALPRDIAKVDLQAPSLEKPPLTPRHPEVSVYLLLNLYHSI